MDEQIARVMYDKVADEVVSYAKTPTSLEGLIRAIRGKLSFPGNMSISEKPDHTSITAKVSLYLDDSKKDEVRVNVLCERKTEGVIAQGSVGAGPNFYACRPYLYD
ncbi:MAG: hypothetical protein WCV90_01025 [Candidatus Woesearchaeota archaeon]|jgi:hypothetical protein